MAIIILINPPRARTAEPRKQQGRPTEARAYIENAIRLAKIIFPQNLGDLAPGRFENLDLLKDLQAFRELIGTQVYDPQFVDPEHAFTRISGRRCRRLAQCRETYLEKIPRRPTT